MIDNHNKSGIDGGTTQFVLWIRYRGFDMSDRMAAGRPSWKLGRSDKSSCHVLMYSYGTKYLTLSPGLRFCFGGSATSGGFGKRSPSVAHQVCMHEHEHKHISSIINYNTG